MINKEASVALYQSISEANVEREYVHWHASSLAQCPRAQYLTRLKVPRVAPTPSAAKILRWNTGHLAEQAIREHVAKVWGGSSQVTSNQRFTSEKWDLTGEFDNHAVEGQTLIEIKTVHDYAFITRNDETTLKQEVKDSNGNPVLSKWGKPTYEPMLTPYLHHEIQNHAYVLLMEEQNLSVTNIDYVYISLSGRVVVYSTEVSKRLLDRVKTRLEELNEAWETKTPPKCLCDPKSPLWGPVYQYCEYKTENDCCSLSLIRKDK